MSPLVTFSNLVDGRAAKTATSFESYDPFTGRPWALIPRCGPTDVDAAVSAAWRAFKSLTEN